MIRLLVLLPFATTTMTAASEPSHGFNDSLIATLTDIARFAEHDGFRKMAGVTHISTNYTHNEYDPDGRNRGRFVRYAVTIPLGDMTLILENDWTRSRLLYAGEWHNLGWDYNYHWWTIHPRL